MSKIKNGGLDQYGAGLSEQQQFGTAGGEGVNGGVLGVLQHPGPKFQWPAIGGSGTFLTVQTDLHYGLG